MYIGGVGQYEKEYNIELIANAQGVIQPPRKIPYAIQPKVKEALDGLKAQNIIADVDTPTDWVSNLVIVEKKSGALRLFGSATTERSHQVRAARHTNAR